MEQDGLYFAFDAKDCLQQAVARIQIDGFILLLVRDASCRRFEVDATVHKSRGVIGSCSVQMSSPCFFNDKLRLRCLVLN